jgi:hypothetical protein
MTNETISEFSHRAFDALTLNTMTAKEMALTPHRLSEGGEYARTIDRNDLFIWSDYRDAWVQVG